jgi:hypothetical protein
MAPVRRMTETAKKMDYIRQMTLFDVNTGLLDFAASEEILERLRPAFEQGQLTSPRAVPPSRL